MRDINLGRDPNGEIPAAVGMTEEEMYDMYRLLAIAKWSTPEVLRVLAPLGLTGVFTGRRRRAAL